MRKMLYQYVPAVADGPNRLFLLADRLEELLRQMENKDQFNSEDYRIRVTFSVDVLAYLFRLLQKAGALDSGAVSQLMLALSKNFVTVGVGQNSLSVSSLTTKYRQVVQGTARSLSVLLVKMLKLLEEEFGRF